jgi:hypothetical protein
MYLTKEEQQLMLNCQSQQTGGMDLFWLYWSAPEGATREMAREDLIHIPPDEFNPPLSGNQFVPLKPFPWASRIVHGTESDIILVGGVGSGKTLNMVMIAGYYCCMLPNFRYLGTAPVSWQAELSYKDFLQQVLDHGNAQNKRRISRWIEKVSLRPYPTIHFTNGSSMEFKSLDKDAASILTWSGDMISVDQAEDSSINLDLVTGNLGTRLRGQVGGRARLGKLIFMANSAYNPELWEMYDRYESDPNSLAMVITSYDNPVLTKKSLVDMERRFRDKDEARRMMMSERPLPKGKEFTGETIARAQSDALDNIMAVAMEEHRHGFLVESNRNAGMTRWITPPQKDRMYIMVGDPGQNNPPYRNSAVVLVYDVTDLPKKPANLVVMDWIYGHGSYWPFINRMLELYEQYNPYIAAFDSTGSQKAFDDLGVLDNTKNWMPVNLGGLKMHMVLCAKVLLARGLIQMPKSAYSIWNQLLMWQMPDTGLQQDIASAVFMAAYVINQVLPRKAVNENGEEDENFAQVENTDRWGRNRALVKRNTRIRRR